jgi:SAM-dependent methyltransferase
VWNSATLEHVESPHIFIRKLHQLLKPNGLLALYVPTIPPFPWLRKIPRVARYFTGHLHGDHINAFTANTLRFFCERAGFKTLEVSSFLPGPLRLLDGLRLIDGVTYIGRKIENWQYPPSATRRAADNPKGFTFVGQVFGELPERD